MQVSQIWQTRGGRKTVTKANNRKHKTRTAKTLGVETFSVGKTKPSLSADNRISCHWTSHSAVLYVVLRPALLTCHRSEKIEISCSNSFSGLIFQVLRTQRSSVSITLSVFKQNEQKVALRRWVFLGHTQPAINPAWTRVQKCPAGPQTPTGTILSIAPIYNSIGSMYPYERGSVSTVVCHLFVVRVLERSAVCSQGLCVVSGEASANFERPSRSHFSLDSRQQAILV